MVWLLLLALGLAMDALGVPPLAGSVFELVVVIGIGLILFALFQIVRMLERIRETLRDKS